MRKAIAILPVVSAIYPMITGATAPPTIPRLLQSVPSSNPLSPGGPSPQKLAKTFDGPPTLERSGSEHRRAVSLFFPEGRRPRREVEPSLRVKRDGVIFEDFFL